MDHDGFRRGRAARADPLAERLPNRSQRRGGLALEVAFQGDESGAVRAGLGEASGVAVDPVAVGNRCLECLARLGETGVALVGETGGQLAGLGAVAADGRDLLLQGVGLAAEL